jgi:uncharacterized membrane protein YcaP (DUF421 family)
MDLLWAGWPPIAHTLLIGTVGYLVLVLLLRGTGPRTMAKMTPLDFVVAVTLGSAFGRTVTADDVPLAQAVAALLLLVTLQWVLASARARWRPLRRMLDSRPALLYYDGELQQATLRRHRLTEADIDNAVIQGGLGSLASVQAVVLHQDGSLGTISTESMGDGSSLRSQLERNN